MRTHNINREVVRDLLWKQRQMLPLITFLYVTLSFLITSDNLLLILAVKSTRSLQKAANFSLVSLAVADLFVGVIVLPLRIVEAQAFSWSRSIFWCQCSLSLTLFSLSATMLNLLILTIERYCAIIVPLFYQSKFSSRRIFYAIVVGWIVAVMVSFLPFVGLKNKTVQKRSNQHRICRFADTMSAEYLSFFSAVVVLFPTLFISYATLKFSMLQASLDVDWTLCRFPEKERKSCRGWRSRKPRRTLVSCTSCLI